MLVLFPGEYRIVQIAIDRGLPMLRDRARRRIASDVIEGMLAYNVRLKQTVDGSKVLLDALHRLNRAKVGSRGARIILQK